MDTTNQTKPNQKRSGDRTKQCPHCQRVIKVQTTGLLVEHGCKTVAARRLSTARD